MTNSSRSGHRKMLLDNYRPILTALVLSIFCFGASAQIIIYPNSGIYGIGYNRTTAIYTMYMPTGCGIPSGKAGLQSPGQQLNQAALFYDSCGHHLYSYDPSAGDTTWAIVGSGGGTGTVDSITISNDSLYYATSTGKTFVALLITQPDSTLKYVTPTQMASALASKLSSVSTANSVQGNGTPGSPVQLAGDAGSPGASQYYGTDGSGAKGYHSLPSGVAPSPPTATIGLTPVNGSATTYMRSDAAPAMGQQPANTMLGNNTVSTATPAYLTVSQVIAMLNAITNFGGNANFLGVNPYASHPTGSITGLYFATDSILTGGWFYWNGTTMINLTPQIAIQVLRLGNAGDSSWFSISGSALTGYIFNIAGMQDSTCLHHVKNPSGYWTWYSTCVVNAGNVSSLQKGLYSARPAASGNAGACWLATDSAQIACSDGTSWTVFARATSTSGVTTDSTLVNNGTSGSPLGVDQNIVRNANYLFAMAFPVTAGAFFYGNSITYGYCPSCPGGVEVNYPTIIQNALGNTTINNGAVSSTSVRTAYAYLMNNLPVSGAPTMGEAAFNNIRILMTGDTLHRFGHVHSAYRAMAALQFLNPATIQFFYSGTGSINSNVVVASPACPGCTFTANDSLLDWSSRAYYYRTIVSGGGGTNAFLNTNSTANQTMTVSNVRGKGIVIGTWADSTGFSRIQVSVDGTVVTTYNPNNRIDNQNYDAGFHRYGIESDAIIIQGLADTAHTVVLTFLDGGVIAAVDYVAGLKDPQACYTTPMYVYDIMHMGAAGYSYSAAPTTQAVQDSCNNSRWHVDLMQFFNAGYPVFQVHENYPVGLYNPGGDPTQVQSDGIHPTGYGQRNIAVAGLNAMNVQQNYAATASTSSATTPFGSAGDVQSAGSGGNFYGNSDLVHDSTNSGTTIGGYLESQAYNSSNAFIGYNTKVKVSAGTYTYINAGYATKIGFSSTGQIFMNTAPSGVANAGVTFSNMPFWIGNNGQMQLSGNQSGTPSAWLDLYGSTTSLASLYMPPGNAPTSGLKNGLFYVSSAGHFNFYNGSGWQQLDQQSGTTPNIATVLNSGNQSANATWTSGGNTVSLSGFSKDTTNSLGPVIQVKDSTIRSISWANAAAEMNLSSGKFLPTGTATGATLINMDSAFYIRNGNIVTVDGSLVFQVSSGTPGTFSFIASLPIASPDLSGQNNSCSGQASVQVTNTPVVAGGWVSGYVGTPNAAFITVGSTTGYTASTSYLLTYHYTYVIQ